MFDYFIVDAFSDRPFLGNPVAIFFDCDGMLDKTMQSIACQMNLSETTFVQSARNGGDSYIKIFTPVNELSFAGHPLLGTALALSTQRNIYSLLLETKKGTFRFDISNLGRNNNKISASVEMEQPPPIVSIYKRSDELLSTLGIKNSTLPIEMYDVGPRHVFIGVETESELTQIYPDIKKLSTHDDLALLCFSPGEEGWRLRMFSPAYGVIEDPATGSAAGPLALHLAKYGLINYGDNITILQGKEIGRESLMHAMALKHGNEVILKASGKAVIMAKGQYYI